MEEETFVGARGSSTLGAAPPKEHHARSRRYHGPLRSVTSTKGVGVQKALSPIP